jgi:hypothetical protein
MDKGNCKSRNCWDIRYCPAGLYMICEAYRKKNNCFEVEKPVCCQNKKDACSNCYIYQEIKKDLIKANI